MPIVTEGINGGAVGANSCRIVYPAATTETDLLDAIEAFITTHGWELWDAAAGANTRAYRAACLPDPAATVEYKYITIRLDGVDRVILELYESWDEVGHTGLNRAFYSDSPSWSQLYDTALGGTLNIYCHAKWLALQSSVAAGVGDPSFDSPNMVLEVRRDAGWLAGTTGPPAVWTNLGRILGNHRDIFSPTRTRLYTGANAMTYTGMVTEMGQAGYDLSGAFSGRYGYGAVPAAPDAMGSRTVALSVLVGHFNVMEIWGRLFGMALLTRGAGNLIGDETTINYSADHVPHPDGTPTECWVIGCTQNEGRMTLPK